MAIINTQIYTNQEMTNLFTGYEVDAYGYAVLRDGEYYVQAPNMVISAHEGSIVHAYAGIEVVANEGSTIHAYSGSMIHAQNNSLTYAYTGSWISPSRGSIVQADVGSRIDGILVEESARVTVAK